MCECIRASTVTRVGVRAPQLARPLRRSGWAPRPPSPAHGKALLPVTETGVFSDGVFVGKGSAAGGR